MITFKDLGNYGRLGNQMFQYALLKSVSDRTGYDMVIPAGNYDLLKMNIECVKMPKDKLSMNVTRCRSFNERFFHFDPAVFNIKNNTNFHGYFQSYKYFEQIKNELHKEYTPNNNIHDICRSYVEDIRKDCDGLVGVHVRRCDYMRLPDYHPFPGRRYYEKCMAYFRARGNYKFLICSDDLEWCKRNINGDDVFYPKVSNMYFDFMIFRLCDHNIIANSSFSWWAAWLEDFGERIVFYPKTWMGFKGPQDWQDLVPGNWKAV